MEDKIPELSSTIHKEAMTLFNHKNILELLSNITELNLTKYDKTFVSKYSEKCFYLNIQTNQMVNWHLFII